MLKSYSNEVRQCQSQGKTIILSLGGETYNEGGWPSAQAAEESAQALWQQYGPTGATFAVDGFDFDFEVPMSNLVPFTQRLLQLRQQAGMDGKFFLTAAPQCQWPDANLGSVLNTHMDWFDAIFVQFYNNPECGIPSGYQKRAGGPSARREGISKRAFSLGTWISQAGQAVSQVGVDVGMALKESAPSSSSSSATTGPTVAPGGGAELASHKPKIYVGVPGSDQGTPQPHMGYVTPDALKSAVSPFLGLKNFGGVSIWDVQYATSNSGFLDQVKAFIGSQ